MRLTPSLSFAPPLDEWYQFRFYARAGGTFFLEILDSSRRKLCTTQSVPDDQHTSFDRVTVRGGLPYYVDDLAIDAL